MATPASKSVRMSHVGMSVSDLQASTRFYADGLGFEEGPSFESGDETAGVSEVEPPVRMTMRFLTKGEVRLGLMGWGEPGICGVPSQHRNQLGLTHLSFEVDDIDATVSRLLSLGGSAIPGARMELGGGAVIVVFLADPDGGRIELLQRGAPS